ncbi:MAG: TatD family hydrolase [Proteobacteria bacterium]|nr:TatD family hydrolase [Pseudomonadota bacterium]MBU1386294.1 TatD family hydrolase [Pseudomonadota bacterium]MBU1542986.1 TatD family hydrolase [Pseudomonadota bacterium]MBU2480009.1 TatD family hydrolase [Pseudomonadota bacterium]
MKLFDSHCHLDDKSYAKDLDAVLENAENNDVKNMMIVGVDIRTSLKAIRIAEAHTHIYTSVGIHPHDAKNWSASDIQTLVRMARENPCVKAWGETGLDFNRMFSPQKDQENCLMAQLEAAEKLDLPLIFHERDSNGRFFDILKAHGPKSRQGVIHCFSGTKEELIKYLDLGYHIGITGILTIESRGKELREMVSMIPENRILIETDAPYLTPAPEKNKYRRNEPAFVKSVLLRLARIKETDPDTLSDIIYTNTTRLYRIDDPAC